MTPARVWRSAAIALAIACVVIGPAIARADDRPARGPDLVPKGSIDAAGLRRLSLEAGRVEARRDREEGERTEKEWNEAEFEPNEGEEPWIEPGNTSLVIPPNQPAPSKAQSFSYTWKLRRSFRGNRFDGSQPLDPALAAGPAHLVTMTNQHINFYSKAGDSLGGATLDAFFPNGSSVPSLFDPRVLYDPGSGRFFAMCLAVGSVPNSAFELAVSNSSDPTTGWTFYEVLNNQDNNGIDYPYMGFGAAALYLAGNYRSTLFGWPVPSTVHSSGLWVIDKAALVAAQSAATWRFVDIPGESHIVSVMPCARWSGTPAGLDNFLVTFENINSTDTRVHAFGVTLPGSWPNGAPSLDRRSYTTTAISAVPNATQLGGSGVLVANNLGSPPSMATFINNRIHTALHAPSGGGLFVRHYEVDVSRWTTVSGTTDDFWDGSSFHYYPAVAVNPWGDVGLVFTRSSSSEFASVHWTIRPQDDGTYQGDGVLKAGESYYGNGGDTSANGYRWGDYSGAAMDPVTGGLWFLHMYARGGTPCFVGIGCQETWIGYVPHAVFADAAGSFLQTGSHVFPWQAFLDAYNTAWNENDVVLKAGSYHAGAGTLSKPLMILSDGGTATITP